MAAKAEDQSAPEPEEDEEDLFQADDDEQAANGGTKSHPSVTEGNTEASGDQDGEAAKDSSAAATQNVESEPAATEANPPAAAQKTITLLSPDAPIPRLPAAGAPSVSNTVPGGQPGEKFGLPADIIIPASVSSTLLQGRLLETLRGLPKQLITDALAEYDDAVQIKGESIRNHGAYLYGVVKRYVSVQERANSGEGDGVLPMGPELTPAVNARLAKLVADGFCTEEEMNDKVKSKIRMLSEKDALFAIEELASVDRSQIRNFGSYFMGILNRYMRGERKDVTSGRKTLAEVRQSFQQQNSSNHRNDDRRRGDRSQRGRLNDPQYRRARDDSNRRERSRDRYDMGGRRDSHNYRDQYDLRNSQQCPPYGHPQIGGNPPPPPPRLLGIPGGASPYQQAQLPPNFGQHPPPMQSPYGQPPGPRMNQHPNQHGGPPMGGLPPGIPYGNHSTPQQRGQPYAGQAPPNQLPYGQQQPFVPQQNPYASLQQGGVPGLPLLQGNSSYGSAQQYMSQQQQQSYANSPYSSPPPTSNRHAQQGGPPDRWGSQPAMQNQLQSPAVDILALADKASSAVQALQNQTKYSMPPTAGLPPSMQQPPNPYQAGAAPQPYGQSPMSIPQSYHPMNNQQYHQQAPPQQSNQAYAGGAQKRRRTTAALNELPITVQYSVQNLQATGQIVGPLDEGMLGMVKDLPEDLALQALQKFATIDKQTMRNKTAYLAGVLRRELEKIHRR